jgi:hypothetical protein
MKTYLAAAAAALALLLAPASAHAQTSYTLWCRGGGDMQMVVGANAIDGHAVTWLRFHFTPMSTAAAASTPPGPGQCSWLDRPLNPDEPQTVQLSARDVSPVSTLNGGVLATIDFNGASASADKARAIWSAYQAGGDFRVMVYNTGGGYMNVTDVLR